MLANPSLVPGPCLAFHRLQYGKVGRAWYFFSHEHDVIDKIMAKGKFWMKKWSCSTSYKFNAWCVWQSPPASLYVWWVRYCCPEPQCAHVQLNPFYHLSTLDVTHVRKDTSPSATFMQLKMVRDWEQG